VPGHDIVVIGASAGGVEALIKLVRGLPADLPAALCVVLHIPAHAPSMLATILNRVSALQAVQPVDGTTIRHGHIYVAPPDHHLIVETGHLRLTRGPKENQNRPAVDPLFRSAALAYGPRVIGVVLTGALDDGTAGLNAIKQRGGIAVVQDPQEAFYPSMPEHAMEYTQVDACLPILDIVAYLARVVGEDAGDNTMYPVTRELQTEVGVSKMETNATSENQFDGKPSAFSCPECGGVLWELRDRELVRFRCRVGHAFSPESMQAAQTESLEYALWTALKTLQEGANLSLRMVQRARQAGNLKTAELFQRRAQEALDKAAIVRDALLNGLPGNANSAEDELDLRDKDNSKQRVSRKGFSLEL
jgi:two-component system chemotaxis response regulator CheB